MNKVGKTVNNSVAGLELLSLLNKKKCPVSSVLVCRVQQSDCGGYTPAPGDSFSGVLPFQFRDSLKAVITKYPSQFLAYTYLI